MAQPTLSFISKSGKVFKKKFKSISSAKRAIQGWTAKGGKMAKKIRTVNSRGGSFSMRGNYVSAPKYSMLNRPILR